LLAERALEIGLRVIVRTRLALIRRRSAPGRTG
jgi:hypothetical protein